MEKNTKFSVLSTLSLLLVFVDEPVQADEAVVLDKVLVEGIASPGDGLLMPQNTPQAKSVVSRPAKYSE